MVHPYYIDFIKKYSFIKDVTRTPTHFTIFYIKDGLEKSIKLNRRINLERLQKEINKIKTDINYTGEINVRTKPIIYYF